MLGWTNYSSDPVTSRKESIDTDVRPSKPVKGLTCSTRGQPRFTHKTIVALKPEERSNGGVLMKTCHCVRWERVIVDDLGDPAWLNHNSQMARSEITLPLLIESAHSHLSTIYCSFHCYEIKRW